MQGNLATTYGELGQLEKALSMERDVYSGRLKLLGEEHPDTLLAASNYASSLGQQRRFEECKALLRKVIPVARRVLGEDHKLTLDMMWAYAAGLSSDDDATLDDLREAVSTLEDAERTTRRVFGSSHPLAVSLERDLRNARAILSVREDARCVAIFAAVALVAAAAYLVM